ncbi:MAG: MFS transporter [Anaerolineae bacterium]|jgi:fucose permease|nr:MFS transporter [Chloroflexota bacterium]
MSLWYRLRHHPHLLLILLAFVAFIALGMPDGLLGVAWPSIRGQFGLQLDAIGMLITAVTAGYMTAAFFSGPVTSRLGVGRVLVLSCALSGLGLIGYTLVPGWGLMVALGVAAGLGAGAIDAGLNTYVAAHFGESIMQWLHAFWGVGITAGPVIMTLGLRRLGSWHAGYHVVGALELVLAVVFAITAGRWADAPRPANGNGNGAAVGNGDAVGGAAADTTGAQPEALLTDYHTPMLESLRSPLVWLSFLMYLLYVGAESGAGVWTYTLLVESRGIEPALAGFFTGSYWATFTVGRLLAGILALRVRSESLVAVSIAGAVLGALLLLWNPSQGANVLAVALIGFSIAPIFPALMSGTEQRVGARHAANTIGLQMTATGLGTMVVPSLMGVLARRVSLETIPLFLLLVCLALAAAYGLAVLASHRSTVTARAHEGR